MSWCRTASLCVLPQPERLRPRRIARRNWSAVRSREGTLARYAAPSSGWALALAERTAPTCCRKARNLNSRRSRKTFRCGSCHVAQSMLVSHAAAPQPYPLDAAPAPRYPAPTIADVTRRGGGARARGRSSSGLDTPAEASRRLLLWGLFVARPRLRERAELRARRNCRSAPLWKPYRRTSTGEMAQLRLMTMRKAPAEPASDWTGSAEEEAGDREVSPAGGPRPDRQ